MNRRTIFCCVSSVALACSLPAFAQTSPDQADGAGSDDMTIVITANKRQESLQDVATAVTAVTGETRDEIGLQSMQDITNFTPGLQYTQSTERVILRGIGRNTNNFGSEPGVANYTDGLYQSFATIAARAPIFVERTEVVRGPQGTLYGRNSIGGAINIISRRPTDEFYAEVRGGFGTHGSGKLQAAMSGRINDLVRGRIAAGIDNQEEGFFENAAGGESEGGRVSNKYVEVQLDGEIGNLDWWVKYGTGSYKNAGPPGGRSGVGAAAPYDSSAIMLTAGITPNAQFAYNPLVTSFTTVGNVASNPGATDPRTFAADTTQIAEVPNSQDIAVHLTYEAPGVDIKYVGGYYWYLYRLLSDVDGTSVTSFTVPSFFPALAGSRTFYPKAESLYVEDRAFFSNEINFISNHDGPLQWMAGLYAYQENYEQPIRAYLPDQPGLTQPYRLGGPFGITRIATAPNPDNTYFFTNNSAVNNSYGVFGQVDWEITDKVKTTLGLRYSHDDKEITETGRLLCVYCLPNGISLPGVGLVTPPIDALDITNSTWAGNTPGTRGVVVDPFTDPVTGLRQRELADTWNALTGTFGFDIKPTEDMLLFIKYSRGYKAGGFNAASFTPNPRTENEDIDAYEAGWKQDWRALDLQTNVAVFLYNYENVQTPLVILPPPVVTPTGTTIPPNRTDFINIPAVETTGFELETTWSPLPELELIFNYAYLNPEIKEACCFVDPVDLGAQQPEAVPVAGAALGPQGEIVQNLAGNVLPQSARHKFFFNARYTFDFDAGSLTPSLTYSWRDKFYSSVFNRRYNETEAYDQVDLRLIWNSTSSNYTVIGFVRNALDQDGYDSRVGSLRRGAATPENRFGTIVTTTTLNYPRTAGVEVQYRF